MTNSTIALLLLATLATTTTACTDASSPSTVTPGRPIADILDANRPTKEQLPQAAATALCEKGEHLPTSKDIQESLGDCVPTSIGWLCSPISVGVDAAKLDGLELEKVWTSTPCQLTEAQGFFVANLDTGEVTCAVASAAQALPLCIR